MRNNDLAGEPSPNSPPEQPSPWQIANAILDVVEMVELLKQGVIRSPSVLDPSKAEHEAHETLAERLGIAEQACQCLLRSGLTHVQIDTLSGIEAQYNAGIASIAGSRYPHFVRSRPTTFKDIVA